MIRYINGRPYAYQCTRENGKPVTRYLGCDQLSLAVAEVIADDAEIRCQLFARERRRIERIVKRDRRFAAIHRVVEILFHSEMQALGYHLHKRSQWRKRRPMATEITTQTTASPESKKALAKQVDTDLLKILKRATEGDKEAVAHVETLLETDLGLRERLIRLAGSPLRAIERKLLKSQTNCPLTLIALREQAVDLRGDLAGPDASPLEQLLVDRIVINHLALVDAELFFQSLLSKESRFVALEFAHKCVDRAHHRFASSISALTTLRRTSPASVTNVFNVSLPAGADFDPETIRTTATVIASAESLPAPEASVPTTPDPEVPTETTMATKPASKPANPTPTKPGGKKTTPTPHPARDKAPAPTT